IQRYHDNVKYDGEWSRFSAFNWEAREQIITPLDWIKQAYISKQVYFAVVCDICISFNFLKEISLKFPNNLFGEDSLFGILLFMQAKNIYLYPKKLYFYRIRPHSVCNYSKSDCIGLPDNIKKIFNLGNEYYEASSHFIMLYDLIVFCESFSDKSLSMLVTGQFFDQMYELSLPIVFYKEDPLGLINKFVVFKKYILYQKRIGDLWTVESRINRHLSYSIGSLIANTNNFFSLLLLPFAVYKIYKKYSLRMSQYKNVAEKFPFVKFLSMDNYLDYECGIKIMKKTPYKFGKIILNVSKFKYLGSYAVLPIIIIFFWFYWRCKNV
ncbi:hypothetical protein CINS5986_07235, partial [Campylobacter insulaenigrae]|nr:hypothetical protein [Campylobacter insulaenigrae]